MPQVQQVVRKQKMSVMQLVLVLLLLREVLHSFQEALK